MRYVSPDIYIFFFPENMFFFTGGGGGAQRDLSALRYALKAREGHLSPL